MYNSRLKNAEAELLSAKIERNKTAKNNLITLIECLKQHVDSSGSKYEATIDLCDFWIDKVKSGEIEINWK